MDTHVTPSVEVLLRYADKELRDRADELQPYIRMTEPAAGRGHPETPYGVLRVMPLPYNRMAGQKGAAEAVQSSGAGARGALEGRVDIDFIIPGTWACGAAGLELGLTKALYRAYHRYMADYCSADSHRLKSMILAPGGDPAWAAQTIREYANQDWVAAVWPVLPEGLPIDDPDLEPVWQAMNEPNLPIIHHSFFYEPPYFPGYRDIWGNGAVARTAAHVWGAERLLAYVLISGMLDRYPNLRVATVETGHGWLPHWIIRLTSQIGFVKGSVPADLQHTPMEYVQMGRVFYGIENHEGPGMTKAVIDLLGDQVLMYQSDFPHPESLFPNGTDTVIGWRTVIGETATRKLMGENAIKYLRLLSSPWQDEAPVAATSGSALHAS